MGRAGWTVISAAMLALVGAIVMLASVAASPSVRGHDGEAWESLLASVDRAIDEDDVPQAIRSWREAYGAALGSRRWQAMLAVGLASLRIGRAAGTLDGYTDRARQCYLTALFRARQQKSAEGALLVAEAFAELGDVAAAARASRLAEALARHERGTDPSAAPLLRHEREPVAPAGRLPLRDVP